MCCQIDKWCYWLSLINGYYEEDLLTITNFILISVADIKWHYLFYRSIFFPRVIQHGLNDLNHKNRSQEVCLAFFFVKCNVILSIHCVVKNDRDRRPRLWSGRLTLEGARTQYDHKRSALLMTDIAYFWKPGV